MSDSDYKALFIRKTEDGSLGWLIPFNIQTTTKIIIFLTYSNFHQGTQSKVVWESMGEILWSAGFQSKF